MDRDLFHKLVRDLGPLVEPEAQRWKRGDALISAHKRVALALYFFAKNMDYRSLAEMFAVGPKSVRCAAASNAVPMPCPAMQSPGSVVLPPMLCRLCLLLHSLHRPLHNQQCHSWVFLSSKC